MSFTPTTAFVISGLVSCDGLCVSTPSIRDLQHTKLSPNKGNVRGLCHSRRMTSQKNEDGEIDSQSQSEDSNQKSMSPLAMAAADWLEGEEDELSMYWERFDAAKSRDSDSSSTTKEDQQKRETNILDIEGVTTEELLDRYYESRGIDKSAERKHSMQINDAVDAAKKATSPEEAIRIMEPVRSYLQFNTKVGGSAYFELALALDASGEEDKATEIYTNLASSPQADLRRRARELLSNPSRPKRQYKKGIWNILWDKWD